MFIHKKTLFWISALTALTIGVSGGAQECQAKSKKRPNRITLGTVEVKNWHSNIVRQYPNLRHFHWNPIYTNVQGVRLVGPPRKPRKKGKQPPAKPVKHKISARHVRFIPAARQRRIYKKPIRVRPGTYPDSSRKVQSSLSSKSLSPALSRKTVAAGLDRKATSAKLSSKKTGARLQSREPSTGKAKSLDIHKRKVAASLGHKKASGKLVSKGVQGKLVKPAASLETPVVKAYKPYATAGGQYLMSGGNFTKSKVQARIGK